MASQVILKKSSVAARVPVVEDLAFGELALNYADGLLYYKKSDGTTIASIGGLDTLATITARGASTSATITVGYLNTGLGVTTGDATIELGNDRTGSGNAILDLHSSAGSDFDFRILKAAGTDGNAAITNKGTGSLSIVQQGAAPLVLSTTNTERVRIDSAGNVGIGTNSAKVKLEIAGNNNTLWTATASIAGTTMDVTVLSGTIAVGDLVYGTNIQPYTRVTAIGTVIGGLGTYTVSVYQTVASVPTIYGTTQYGSTLMRITDTDTNQAVGQPTGALQFFTSDLSTPTAGVGAYVAAIAESITPDTSLVFGTRNNAGGGVDANERMRLDSSGNLGIGTSSPTSTLSVTGTANVTGNVTLGDVSTDTVTVNGYMAVGGTPSAAYNILVTGGSTTGVNQYSIGVNTSNVLSGTTFSATFLATSSILASTAVTNAAALRVLNMSLGVGATITSQHGVRIEDLSSGTNNYGITSLVSSGTNKWNIYASGTAQNYFAGNVLIGDASPSAATNALLSVGKATSSETDPLVHVFDSSDDLGLKMWQADSPDRTFNVKIATSDSANGSLAFGAQSSTSSLRFSTGTSVTYAERMRINSSGNVGIGTISPVSKLHVGGAGNVTGGNIHLGDNTDGVLKYSLLTGSHYNGLTNPSGFSLIGGLSSSAANLVIIGGKLFESNAANEIQFFTDAETTNTTGGTQRMTLDSSGNLGIGTGTGVAASRLHIRQDQDGITRQIIHNRNATGTPLTELTFITSGVDISDSRYAYIQSGGGSSNYLSLGTSNGAAPAERLRIDAAGTSTFYGVYANTYITTYGSIFVDGTSTNNILQLGSLARTHGGGLWSTGVTTRLYSVDSIEFRTGVTLRDQDTPQNGTTVGTLDTSGNLTITGAVSARYTTKCATATTATSVTPNISTANQYAYTALASALTINAPTGTPVDGDKLTFRIKDNGTSRALTWNAIYRVIGTVLPSSTVLGKLLYVGCIYNAADTKWDVTAVAREA